MTTDINHDLGTTAVLWDLRALYPAADAPEIQQDMQRCRRLAELLAAEFAGRVAELDAGAINQAVERLESLDTLLARLGAFAFLHFITQTGDAGGYACGTAAGKDQSVEARAANQRGNPGQAGCPDDD